MMRLPSLRVYCGFTKNFRCRSSRAEVDAGSDARRSESNQEMENEQLI